MTITQQSVSTLFRLPSYYFAQIIEIIKDSKNQWCARAAYLSKIVTFHRHNKSNKTRPIFLSQNQLFLAYFLLTYFYAFYHQLTANHCQCVSTLFRQVHHHGHSYFGEWSTTTYQFGIFRKQLGGSVSTVITIKIRKWESYKGRKDVEHHSWFRCSNRLLEDPDFFDFSAEEILVWVYVLSLASQKNSGVVVINLAHAERVARLKKQAVLNAIEKLKQNQIDPVDVTQTLRERDADGTSTGATDKQTDITNKQTDSTTTVAKETTVAQRTMNDPIEIHSIENLFEKIPVATKQRWFALYPDQDYVKREMIKAFGYYVHDNPRKCPKTLRGWSTALSSWLERGWPRHAKTIQSEASQPLSISDILGDQEVS